ncbi:hypothetical protein DICPUDRAFT_93851 [Dictyostelium purpureum]|uniref:Beta-hexosaminidase n=1 Tax=Dictyostelium purpureum TaxID=5786 RepID=F0ZCI5_DICPU|nr:uncharacterized protein DICPUDRAFT_93851 [Dictyostelium purpureum]EGC38374.1 hypothetical protein DICPUDRAFT_93851 [Dictyostelium purpureum]|eukprot:XP_003285131.1 hypothetical protein DICPUDRAFT_93851 [Dictyostelium purpureum]
MKKSIILLCTIILSFIISKSVSIRFNNININRDNNDGVIDYTDNNINNFKSINSENSNDFSPNIVAIWPKPKTVNHGNQTFQISSKFYFSSNLISSELLNNTAKRYYKMIFKEDNKNIPSDKEVNYFNYLKIEVYSDDETLKIGFNESYTLHIKETYGILKAGTVYGAMRGLETFYQMVFYNYSSQGYFIPEAPWNIYDEPRFPHRGVMLDTSRHWYSTTFLKKFIDSLSYNKFNTFHWHAVDSQSFPLTSTTFPNMTRGAWTPLEIYSTKDIKEIVQHAKERGIRVVLEVDMPGHAKSWGEAFSEVIPDGIEKAPGCNWDCSTYCDVPLDPSKQKSYDVAFSLLDEFTGTENSIFQDDYCDVPIDPTNPLSIKVATALLEEYTQVFNDSFFHVGGDEINYDCWKGSGLIQQWMENEKYTSFDNLTMYFEEQVFNKLIDLGKTPIVWEETFDVFGTKLSKDVIVQVYHSPTLAKSTTGNGYKTLLSPADFYYLELEYSSWQRAYSFEPTSVISQDNIDLLLGGEGALWTDTIGVSQIISKIYPSASSIAEKLWSPININNTDIAEYRLESFHCSLIFRGINSNNVLSTSIKNLKSCSKS